jgi:hypothetical protein
MLLSRAEGWSDWDSSPISVSAIWRNIKELIICPYIVFSITRTVNSDFVLNTINRLVLLWRGNVEIRSLVIFDIHGSVHRRWLSRNTIKMQLCNRIYYSKVYWRLNMFRTAHRSSSGALTVFAAFGLFTHMVAGRRQGWAGKWISHSALTMAGHHMGI